MINPVVESDLLNTLRELAKENQCRLEIASDAAGLLGECCCVASNNDRSVQGFGPTLPCQPWSQAGKQRGQDDHRHLWPAMCGVIEEVGPSWIIGENVFGLVSLGLESVCADLEARGYPSELYEDLYTPARGWRRIERAAQADGAAPRTEVLWLRNVETDMFSL